jgi:hypothetical protein
MYQVALVMLGLFGFIAYAFKLALHDGQAANRSDNLV